jgi:ABC-type nitrate/sulfonate/bicarbonate transport system permease component
MPPFLRDSRASGYILIAGLAALWEASVRFDVVHGESWPPLSEVFAVLVDPQRSAEVLSELGNSAARMTEAFFIGGIAGILSGVAMGLSRRVYSTLELSVEFLRVVPIPALIPPAILFLGLEDMMKVSITALSVFWPVLLNAMYGVRGVDEALVETARTFRTGPQRMIWKVFVPAAAPWIIAGLRLGLGSALITTVVAEMIVGSTGIGAYIVLREQAGRMSEVYAAILALSLFGYAGNRLLLWCESTLAPWAVRRFQL